MQVLYVFFCLKTALYDFQILKITDRLSNFPQLCSLTNVTICHVLYHKSDRLAKILEFETGDAQVTKFSNLQNLVSM